MVISASLSLGPNETSPSAVIIVGKEGSERNEGKIIFPSKGRCHY